VYQFTRQPANLIRALVLLALAPSLASTQDRSLPELVRDATSAVVFLRAYDATGSLLGVGSGFYIPDGRVATNVHVVEGASSVEVLNGEGRLIGAVDHASSLSASVDLAILPALGTPGATLSFATGEPQVGEIAIAIGSPQGLTNTVSQGIVSAIRNVDGRAWVQITAPISPGSSGGPVLNDEGRVIGISVSQMREGQNLNFAVPVRDLAALASSPPGRLSFPAAERTGYAGAGRGTGREPGSTQASAAAVIRAFPALAMATPRDGTLTSDGFVSSVGKYVDFYRFDGRSGQTVTILVTSTDFDPYVVLSYTADGEEISTLAEDDDSGPGLSAIIVQRLPATSTYAISVTSYQAGAHGRYTVGVYDGDYADVVLGAGVTGPNGSGRWREVSWTDDFTVSLDLTSVRRIRSNLYEAWTRTFFPNGDELTRGQVYSYRMELVEVDCQRRRSRFLEITYYAVNGNVVFSRNTPSSSFAWVPGSVGESTGESICTGTR
jgi:hypothetical protein